jgi:hypothetical protein
MDVLNDPAFTQSVADAAATIVNRATDGDIAALAFMARNTVTGRINYSNPENNESAFTQPERRQEHTRMAKAEALKVGNIILETGQQQERQASNLLFFVYVTPTGAEISIGKCPHLQRVWGQTEGGFEGQTRIQRTEFRVLSPTTIKMVNICTVFGSPKRTVNLFIDLAPDHASIELTGLESFGLFKGRGKINMRKSYYREHQDMSAFTNDMIKELFNFKILQPPRIEGAKKVRSLIY